MSFVLIVLALMAQESSQLPQRSWDRWPPDDRGSLDELSEKMRLHHAIQLFRAGKVEEAVNAFQHVTARHPHVVEARMWLGRIAMEREHWVEAQTHFETALGRWYIRDFRDFRTIPTDALIFLSMVRDELGDRAGAISALDTAIQRTPWSMPARIERARMALRANDLKTAFEHYREVFSNEWHTHQYSTYTRQWRRVRQSISFIAPEAPPGDAFAGMARVAQRMKALELARCAADEAVERAPENASFHALLADISEQDGDIEQGRASAQRAFELDFESAELYRTLGKLHHATSDWPASIAAFEKASSLAPAAAEHLPMFPLESLTTADYASLRRMLETADANHPDSRPTLHALGAIYLRDGKLDRSRELFERLRVLDPNDSAVEHSMATIHSRQGSREGWEHAMTRYDNLKVREDEARSRADARARRWTEFRALSQQSKYHEDAVAIGLELIESGPADPDQLATLSATLAKLGRRYHARILIAQILEQSPYHFDALALGYALEMESVEERLALIDSICN